MKLQGFEPRPGEGPTTPVYSEEPKCSKLADPGPVMMSHVELRQDAIFRDCRVDSQKAVDHFRPLDQPPGTVHETPMTWHRSDSHFGLAHWGCLCSTGSLVSSSGKRTPRCSPFVQAQGLAKSLKPAPRDMKPPLPRPMLWYSYPRTRTHALSRLPQGPPPKKRKKNSHFFKEMLHLHPKWPMSVHFRSASGRQRLAQWEPTQTAHTAHTHRRATSVYREHV